MPGGRELLARPKPGQEAASSATARKPIGSPRSLPFASWSASSRPAAPMSDERRAYFGQAPLRMGEAGGALEQEADRAAAGEGWPQPGRAGASAGSALLAPELGAHVQHAIGEAGTPLPAAARGAMEPRFGHDLSDVRVHTGPAAAQAARALDARALTVGNDVVFGANQYAPGTPSGQQLLAHELAHTVQQAGASELVQRAPLHQALEDRFEKETGFKPRGGAHGQDYESWLLDRPRQAAIVAHRAEQDRIYALIDAGLKHKPDPKKGPLNLDTLFRNTCQLIASKRIKTTVVTKTHDAMTRTPDTITYFDKTVFWPDKGGDYPKSSSVTMDPRLVTAPLRKLGAYSQGVLKLIGTEDVSDPDELRRNIVHEMQHAADRIEVLATDNPGGLTPIYRVAGTPSSSQLLAQNSKETYNAYQSEFRAYWIQVEEGTLRSTFGSSALKASNSRKVPADEGQLPISTNFVNLRQERIFWWLVDNPKEYDYARKAYVSDPGFKAMVDSFTSPLGGNLINSIRILELGDAIEACDPSLDASDPLVKTVRAKARALDATDRAFLKGKFSEPFWEHARRKLPAKVAASLL